MMKKKYSVFVEWDYIDKYERCVISYATKDVEKYDGYNVIGHSGREGCEIDIYPTLEEAIIKSHFNPQAIDFQLDEKDLIEVRDIISKYDWSYEKGLIKKEMKMQLTKESILIDAQPSFAFMLHYDWEKGIIWLSKNSAKSKKVRLTTKDVYISEGEKDRFYRSRTGYGPDVELGLLKPCSYITKRDNENIFNYWVKFMYERYMNLKHRQEAIDKGDYNE